MKIVVCLAALCACVALVASEPCDDTTDCGHVGCPFQNYTLGCVTKTCTCFFNNSVCTMASDCSSLTDKCGHNHGWECDNNVCHCRHDNGNHGSGNGHNIVG